MIFNLDALIAFFIILIFVSFSFSFLYSELYNLSQDYKEFNLQKQLIEVSELMISNSEQGLAIYDENTVKHHEIKARENFEFQGFHIEVLELNEKSNYKGNSISRIALCGDEICVVKVTA